MNASCLNYKKKNKIFANVFKFTPGAALSYHDLQHQKLLKAFLIYSYHIATYYFRYVPNFT